MAAQNCCSNRGSEIFIDWVIPEGLVHRHFLGPCYKAYPTLSRIGATPSALIAGVAKILLFPVMCAVGVIAMPIIAYYRTPPRHTDGGEWLKAWFFCLLGVGVSGAVLVLPVYYFNLVSTAGLYVGILSFSIVVHVYKLVKEPPSPDDESMKIDLV